MGSFGINALSIADSEEADQFRTRGIPSHYLCSLPPNNLHISMTLDATANHCVNTFENAFATTFKSGMSEREDFARLKLVLVDWAAGCLG